MAAYVASDICVSFRTILFHLARYGFWNNVADKDIPYFALFLPCSFSSSHFLSIYIPSFTSLGIKLGMVKEDKSQARKKRWRSDCVWEDGRGRAMTGKWSGVLEGMSLGGETGNVMLVIFTLLIPSKTRSTDFSNLWWCFWMWLVCGPQRAGRKPCVLDEMHLKTWKNIGFGDWE